MADLRTLYKGAAGVRKGQAMLAWLGDVAVALEQVGDLGKTLVDLREKVQEIQGTYNTIASELQTLRSRHAGFKAEARKIRADAKSAAAAIVEEAKIEIVAIGEKATAQAAAQRDVIENDRAAHKKFMTETGAKEIVLRGKVAKLTEELAAIKARL